MLILSRRDKEVILIGDDIKIIFIECKRRNVKVGIIAPKSIVIRREEVPEIPKEKKDD